MKKRNLKTLQLKKDIVSAFDGKIRGGRRFPTDGCTEWNGCSHNCSIVEDCNFEKL